MGKRVGSWIVAIILVAGLGTGFAAEPEKSPEVLYQNGLYLETAKGDYEGAIGVYEKIVDKAVKDRKITAKALYRMGLCYEKIGNHDKAKEIASKLKKTFDKEISKIQSIGDFVKAINEPKYVIADGYSFKIDDDMELKLVAISKQRGTLRMSSYEKPKKEIKRVLFLPSGEKLENQKDILNQFSLVLTEGIGSYPGLFYELFFKPEGYPKNIRNFGLCGIRALDKNKKVIAYGGLYKRTFSITVGAYYKEKSAIKGCIDIKNIPDSGKIDLLVFYTYGTYNHIITFNESGIKGDYVISSCRRKFFRKTEVILSFPKAKNKEYELFAYDKKGNEYTANYYTTKTSPGETNNTIIEKYVIPLSKRKISKLVLKERELKGILFKDVVLPE